MMENVAKMLLPTPQFEIKSNKPENNSFQYQTPSGMTLQMRRRKPAPQKQPQQLEHKELVNEKQSFHKNRPTWSSNPRTADRTTERGQPKYNGKQNFNNRWNNNKSQAQLCPRGAKKDEEVSVRSDLLEQIKKLNTPEEIQAWRDERKKRYPTLANVQMREKAQEQRQKRGERLTPNQSRFGKHKERMQMQRGAANHNRNSNQTQENAQESIRNNGNDNNKNKRKRKRGNRNNATNDAKKVVVDLSQEKAHDENLIAARQECGGVLMFQGTSKLRDYKHEAWRKLKVNGLSALFDMYGSDDNDSEDREEEAQEAQIDILQNECVSSVHTETDCAKFKSEQNKENNYTNHSTTVKIATALKLENEGTKQNVEPTVVVVNTEIDALSNTGTISCNISEIDKEKSSIIVNAAAEGVTEPAENHERMQTNEEADHLPNASSEEAPDEAPIAHVDKLTSNSIVKHKSEGAIPKSRQPCKRKFGLDYRKTRMRKQNTMLEKLLASDIRHERNVLLQCVRFVCENNFFGIADKNGNQS